VLRSSHNRSVFEQGPTDQPIRIEFIDQQYLDVFIKQQMHDAMQAQSHSLDETECAHTVTGIPESPLPDVSIVSASPGGDRSLAMTPMSGLAASQGAGRRGWNFSTSPLVKFSSPCHAGVLMQETPVFKSTHSGDSERDWVFASSCIVSSERTFGTVRCFLPFGVRRRGFLAPNCRTP